MCFASRASSQNCHREAAPKVNLLSNKGFLEAGALLLRPRQSLEDGLR